MKKKKTYVFEEETLDTLKKIKQKTGKSETQILKEAIILYEKYLNDDEDGIKTIKDIASKLEKIVNRLDLILTKLSDR
ncbi:hypothetical protein [Persephonella sp.]